MQQTHIDVEATVKVEGKTGVEMEALTACSVACLTIYDMLKAVDRGMTHHRHAAGGKVGRQIRHLQGGLKPWRCSPSLMPCPAFSTV